MPGDGKRCLWILFSCNHFAADYTENAIDWKYVDFCERTSLSLFWASPSRHLPLLLQKALFKCKHSYNEIYKKLPNSGEILIRQHVVMRVVWWELLRLCSIGHICILGIGLALACDRGWQMALITFNDVLPARVSIARYSSSSASIKRIWHKESMDRPT